MSPGTVVALGLGAAAVVAAASLGPERGLGFRRSSAGRSAVRSVRQQGDRRPPRQATTAARWARPRDLGALCVRANRRTPAGRLALGRLGRRTVATERAQSVIVFGPTQSYKTTGFAVPAILEWSGPVVAASVKGDLLEDTAGHRATVGSVHCFDPTGTTGRPVVTWSPLPTSRTWPGARRSAATLTEVGRAQVGTMTDGDFWYATASRLLAPLLFAAATDGRDMAEVVHWVETGEEHEVLDLLYAAGVPEAIDAARSAFGKEERQRSSIVTTLETLLEPFALATPHGAPQFDPAALMSGSDSLYLCAPAHDQRRLTPLFVGILRAVLDQAFDRVMRSGKPLDPALLVVLDEAANIAPIPDLDTVAATAAGHGIQLVTIWHDMAQISARFGPRAATVVNNHRAKLFLSGISDPGTLDYASHLVGEEERSIATTTSGGRSGPSTSHAPTLRRLAPPDALRRTRPGKAVLVYRDLPPALLTLRTWFDDRRLSRLARPGPTDTPRMPATEGAAWSPALSRKRR